MILRRPDRGRAHTAPRMLAPRIIGGKLGAASCRLQILLVTLIASETCFRCHGLQPFSVPGPAAAVRWFADGRPRGTAPAWQSSA